MDLAHPHGKFTGALSRSLKSMSNLTALEMLKHTEVLDGLSWDELERLRQKLRFT